MKSLLCFLLLALSVASFSQAGGPNCASAVLLPCNGSISGSTAGTAPDGVTTGNFEGTGGQHWFYITPAGSGTIQISLCNPSTTYDSRVHCYSGSCGSYTFVGQDDDTCLNPGLASDLTVSVTAGVTYYFRIGGFGGASGPYAGTVTCNIAVAGCTYSEAVNYNPSALQDDGSCIFTGGGGPLLGCMDTSACNYCNLCTQDNNTCNYDCLGCTYPAASNYDSTATRDDGSCVYDGCTDPLALNYNPIAANDDGSCVVVSICNADLNFDGIVSVADLVIFIGAFGSSCP